MSFKSFLAGSFIALVIGSITAQFNDILGVIVGVVMGSLVAGTKKSSGFIGFVFSPFILYSGLIIYSLVQLTTGGMAVLEFAFLVLGALFNMFTTIIAIVGLIIGVVTAHLYIKFTTEKPIKINDKSLEELEVEDIEIDL